MDQDPLKRCVDESMSGPDYAGSRSWKAAKVYQDEHTDERKDCPDGTQSSGTLIFACMRQNQAMYALQGVEALTSKAV